MLDSDHAKERGRLLREARREKGLTQARLAAEAGVFQSQVSNIERGITGGKVTADTIHRLEITLGLPAGYFMPGVPRPKNARAESLERFLRSPLAHGVMPDEEDALRKILPNLDALQGINPDRPITENAWYLYLQACRTAKATTPETTLEGANDPKPQDSNPS